MPKVVFNEVLKFQKIGLTVLSQLSLQYFNTPRVCYPYLIINHQNKIDRIRCRLKLQRSICDEGFQQSSLVCCCLVGVGGARPMWGLCRLSLFLIFFFIGTIFLSFFVFFFVTGMVSYPLFLTQFVIGMIFFSF